MRSFWEKFSIAAAFLILFSSCTSPALIKGPKIRVAIPQGSSLKIHEIPLEKYVMGVLEKEVPADWPPEALKAQAIASRSYALYRMRFPRDKRFDVDSNVNDQVFVKKKHYAPAIEKAVVETEGQSLTYGGNPLAAFFHSCCGGKSEPADKVWPGSHAPPLLHARDDAYCSASPRSHWELSISRQELAELLDAKGHPLGDNWRLDITERDDSGRVIQVNFHLDQGDFNLSGTNFREILGNTRLLSTLFEITDPGDPTVFSGRGSGHGVGLCQWGAKGMADEGKSVLEILEFYYPGAQVKSMDSETEPSPETDPIGNIINEGKGE